MNNSFVNFVIAIVLSISVIIGWQFFYEKPRAARIANQLKVQNQQKIYKHNKDADNAIIDRSQALKSSNRIQIHSKVLSGSISLQGGRFDDLSLLKYHKNITKDSGVIELFSPAHSRDSYFAEIGWKGRTAKVTFPNESTIWESNDNVLYEGGTVNLYWMSPENIKFKISITLDENYLFTIKQCTENHSQDPIEMRYFGLIKRMYEPGDEQSMKLLHQGMIGAMDGELQEYTYESIKKEKKNSFGRRSINWLGFTDKYWLSALIPDQKQQYKASCSYAQGKQGDIYQTDIISQIYSLEPGATFESKYLLFAGPKKVDLLDKYEEQNGILLFDRAIDFGWFYILTKPIFNAMNFFYSYVGNFGVSMMIVTILIKLVMFTLTNKSYRSMKKMKEMQPEMERLKELYGDDKINLNKAVIELYKREKINPITGCLPMLLQIPVFFSIYKVLYVTIEMRHAPFFGWIKDLSAPDPTSIFNLFGLLSFTPPVFLMIGAWPIIMSCTMFLQQRMTPEPTDPVQAKVMKFMPLMFLFMFNRFPSGLLIYWSWSNILSIIQQSYINMSRSNGK